MFLSLAGEDSGSLYTSLVKAKGYRICRNGLVYVGWNPRLINKGNYFYAFSHNPIYKLDIPKRTFTVSCFRDPIKRIVSHYSNLTYYRDNNINHPCMKREGPWLGSGFDDFIQRMPKEHMLNQLYMYSSNFDINEAVKRVSELSYYFFIDDFDNGINQINKQTGLNLEPIHIRKSDNSVPIAEESMAKLRGMLDDEYEFIGRIREMQNTQ